MSHMKSLATPRLPPESSMAPMPTASQSSWLLSQCLNPAPDATLSMTLSYQAAPWRIASPELQPAAVNAHTLRTVTPMSAGHHHQMSTAMFQEIAPCAPVAQDRPVARVAHQEARGREATVLRVADLPVVQRRLRRSLMPSWMPITLEPSLMVVRMVRRTLCQLLRQLQLTRAAMST